jgi:thymidylate kinase
MYTAAADPVRAEQAMQISDDTPERGSLPDIYPREPPRNLLPPALRMPRNLYAFEGVDASGKSSIVAGATRHFAAHGRAVHQLKVGGSELIRHAMERTKWINADPACFNLLNWVSLYHQTGAIPELYNSPTLIFADRYAWTVKIRGRLEGLPDSFVDAAGSLLPRPAMTFIIDCPTEACLARIREHGRTISYFEAGVRHVDGPGLPMQELDPLERTRAFDREPLARRHFDRMRAAYLDYAANDPGAIVIENHSTLNAAIARVVASINQHIASR